MSLAYLDASAIVKLIIDEPESGALYRWYVESDRLATSRIGVVESVRATARTRFDRLQRDRILAALEVLELTAEIAATAGTVSPPLLRSLDAIHLASALALVPELDAFVTYDDRLADAARSLGLPVVRPA